jgi:hypothetical protein
MKHEAGGKKDEKHEARWTRHEGREIRRDERKTKDEARGMKDVMKNKTRKIRNDVRDALSFMFHASCFGIQPWDHGDRILD